MSNASSLPRSVWLVTGCSTGFGHELAAELLRRGHRVVLTARDTSTIAELAAEHPDRALAVELDVTNPGQVEHALRAAERAFGTIDVLVNNAGYGYYAAIEEGDEPAVRAMFETNFFALVRLMRAVLPAMRARRGGTIVNISSAAAHVAHPGSGYYAATKAAVESVSEALSKEVAPLGIRVLLVEPGPFRTRFVANARGEIAVRDPDYESTVGVRRASVHAGRGRERGDPVKAAGAIIDVVASPSAPLRLVLGSQALGNIRGKLASFTQEIDRWQATTVAVDHPD